MPEDLEGRLSEVEAALTSFHQLDNARMAADARKDAKFMALYSIVQDLALSAGINEDDFLKHYQARIQFWLGARLSQIESIDPALAALIDQRDPDEVTADSTYPDIFDPPP